MSDYITPVMYIDPCGESFTLVFLGILAAGILSGLSSMSDLSEGEDGFGAFAGGFVNGVVSATGLALALAAGPISWGGIAVAGISGFAGGFLGDVTTQQISYGNVDLGVASMYGAKSVVINFGLYLGLGATNLFGTSSNFLINFKEALYFSEIGVGASIYFDSFITPNYHKYRSIEPTNRIKDLSQYDWGY